MNQNNGAQDSQVGTTIGGQYGYGVASDSSNNGCGTCSQ